MRYDPRVAVLMSFLDSKCLPRQLIVDWAVQVALLMAREPSARLAGDPVAFFVGKNSCEGVESWLAQVAAAGFSTGDDAIETEFLQRLMQACPHGAKPGLPQTLMAPRILRRSCLRGACINFLHKVVLMRTAKCSPSRHRHVHVY